MRCIWSIVCTISVFGSHTGLATGHHRSGNTAGHNVTIQSYRGRSSSPHQRSGHTGLRSSSPTHGHLRSSSPSHGHTGHQLLRSSHSDLHHMMRASTRHRGNRVLWISILFCHLSRQVFKLTHSHKWHSYEGPQFNHRCFVKIIFLNISTADQRSYIKSVIDSPTISVLELARFSSHRDLTRPDPVRQSRRHNSHREIQSPRRQGGCGRCHLPGEQHHHHHHRHLDHVAPVVHNPAFHY